MRKHWLLVGTLLLVFLLLSATLALAKPKSPPGLSKKNPSTKETTTTTESGSTTTETTSGGNTETSTTSPTTNTPTTSTNGTNTVTTTAGGETNWEMIGALLGLIALIGVPVGWWFNQRRRQKMSAYLTAINKAYSEYEAAPVKSEAALVLLETKVERDFAAGKLDDRNLEFLHRKIESYLREIRTGTVEGMKISGEAKAELRSMLQDGKISKDEYEGFVQSKKFSKADIAAVKKHLSNWRKQDAAATRKKA